MTSRRTYYVILGVSEGDPPAAVRAAFRDLAQRYHPDRAGSDATPFFQEIVEAYETLSDPERRASYDQGLRHMADGRRAADGSVGRAPRGGVGRAPVVRVGRGPRGAVEPLVPGRIRDAGWQDLQIPLEELGGRLQRSMRAGRPAGGRVEPITARLHLSRRDALLGGQVEVDLPDYAPCPACHGSGAGPWGACQECGGAGLVLRWRPHRLVLPPGLATGDVVGVAARGFGLHGVELRLHVVVN